MTMTLDNPVTLRLAALADLRDAPEDARMNGLHLALTEGATWPQIADALGGGGAPRDRYLTYARAEYRLGYLTRGEYALVLAAVASPDCPACTAAEKSSLDVYSIGTEDGNDLWECDDCNVTWTTPAGADPADPPPPLEQARDIPYVYYPEPAPMFSRVVDMSKGGAEPVTCIS